MRKVMVVVLVFLCFGITAYAFSSVAQKTWHSRLEKGAYRGTDAFSSVYVIVAAEDEHESTPTDAIVSEPLQIIVATQDEVVVEEESTVNPVEEEHTSETIGE